MSGAVQSMAARKAVRWLRTYRSGDRPNVVGTFPEPLETIYGRLENDPKGRVSAALAALVNQTDAVGAAERLRAAALVLSYVAQAADLALSAPDVSEQCTDHADDFKKYAAMARELRSFCEGQAPIHLWSPLGELAEFLQSQAKHYTRTPAELQIKKTHNMGDKAAAALALRHLAKRLREEFGKDRLPHDALAGLVHAALGLSEPIAPDVVNHAISRRL